MSGRFVVYAFATTHDALAAERALVGAGIDLATIPTPQALGSLCGIAIRVAEASARDAEEALAACGIAWSARAVIEDRAPRTG